MTQTPESACLMGALTADAAALGLHWLYDVDRIAAVAGDNPAAFMPVDAAHFKDAKGYFAHAARSNGMLSQYGETLRLAMTSITAKGGFETEAYQQAYSAHFGPGGAYHGYIDRPTRGTLENLAKDQSDPSGVNDDQHPAISTLPAIVARYRNAPDFHAHVEAAIKITNVNPDATRYGVIFADLLAAILSGAPLQDALRDAAKSEPLLQKALDATESNSVAYGEVTNRACHLPQGMPLSFHILSRTTDYKNAVETNIRAGGDSCGRAIMIGALAGAAYSGASIPEDWLSKLADGPALQTLSGQIKPA